MLLYQELQNVTIVTLLSKMKIKNPSQKII